MAAGDKSNMCPKDLPPGVRHEVAGNRRLGHRRGEWPMPTSEEYRQMANRTAQMALALDYMAQAAKLSRSATATQQ
jgi:hypothetical protein